MQVSKMMPEDILQVHQIEESTFSVPWSYEAIEDAAKREETIYLTAKEDEEVLGYAGMWTVLGEGEIVQVAVKESARRRGVADAIMNALIEEGRKKGIDIFFLEVRQSNAAAIKLYEKHGFINIGTRKNFYERPVENAIVMSLTFFEKNSH